MEGHHPKKDAQIDQQHLIPAAETALVEHIWHCAVSRYPLTPALLQQYANTIMHPVPGHDQLLDVTHTWLQAFLLQHPAIWTHWSCCLDNACLTGATNEIICQWYIQLNKIMCEYCVASTNVFNMDKTGFMFGQASSKDVVISSGNPASQCRVQPGT